VRKISVPYGKGNDTIGRRAQQKNQAKKSSQMHECKIPLNKCISSKFSSLDAKLPLET
jgi:hypothetical protein